MLVIPFYRDETGTLQYAVFKETAEQAPFGNSSQEVVKQARNRLMRRDARPLRKAVLIRLIHSLHSSP